MWKGLNREFRQTMVNFFSVNYSSCREDSYAYDDKSTRSRDFSGEHVTESVEKQWPEHETTLHTFIYLFSTNGTREELLPSENFRVNKTTLTNTDPPFINCTDRAPNEATRLADSFRSSRRREETIHE